MQPRREMKGTTRVLWQVMAKASWKHSPMTVVILTTAKRLTHGHTGAWRGANMSAHLEVIRI